MAIIIPVVLLALLLSETIAMEQQLHSSDDGFCVKTDEGVRCISAKDITLTRFDSQQAGELKEIEVEGKKLQLKTLSVKPSVFEIENFLSDEECDHLISEALKKGLYNSHTLEGLDDINRQRFELLDENKDHQMSIDEMRLTIENAYEIFMEPEEIIQMYKDLKIDKNEDNIITPDELDGVRAKHFAKYLKRLVKEKPEKKSRLSKQAWLNPDESTDEIFIKIQNRVASAVQLPLDLVKLSDFQVVKYDVKGHYDAHHDSVDLYPEQPCCDTTMFKDCRICRYMTILFYLNDVEGGGETAFPMANNETYDVQKVFVDGTAHLYKNCGEANLRVPPKKGKVIFWYNHFIDKETGWMGNLDFYTLHGGCPVTEGEKWIGNFWIMMTDTKAETIEKMKKFHATGQAGP